MLGTIGEALLDCVVGIIAIVIEVILIVIAFFLDIIINTFSFVFKNDFVHNLYQAMPFLNNVDSIFTTIGMGIAILLLVLMIYQMAMGPLLSNRMQPRAYVGLVLVRTFIVIPLVICANKISIWLANFFATMYSGVYDAYSHALNSYTGNGNPFYLSTTIAFYVFSDGRSSIGNMFDTFTQTDNIEQGLSLPEGVMETLTTLASVVLILVLVILVGWNLIQFFLEVFERFAVMFFIMKVSPLCIATAINPSTQNIATSWLKFFIGQFTLWVMQIMCMGWVISCLGDLQDFRTAFTNDAMGGLMAWAGICYGLINMSRHVDDYINKLGLSAATTGSDFFRDINAMASAIRTGKSIGGATSKAVKNYAKTVSKATAAAGLPGASAAQRFFKNEKGESDGTTSASGSSSASLSGKNSANSSANIKKDGAGASSKGTEAKNLNMVDGKDGKVDAEKGDAAKGNDKVTFGQIAKAAAVTSAFVVGGMMAGPVGVAGAAAFTTLASSGRQFFKAKDDITKANNISRASDNIKSRVQSTHTLPGTTADRTNFDTSVSMPELSDDGKTVTADGSYNSVATNRNDAGVVTEAEMTNGRIIPSENDPTNFDTATITQDEKHTFRQDGGANEEEARYTVDDKSYVVKNVSDDTGEAYETYSLDKENNETLKFVQRGHYENGAAEASFDSAKHVIKEKQPRRQPQERRNERRNESHSQDRRPHYNNQEEPEPTKRRKRRGSDVEQEKRNIGFENE